MTCGFSEPLVTIDDRWCSYVTVRQGPCADPTPGDFLRARSAPGLLTRNCGLLRSVTAGEKRLVSIPAWANQRSGSFTVCPAPSRPSQPLIAARLLPDADNGI